jgi:hypothetical protein
MCQWIKQNERAWELLFCSCVCVKKKKKKKKKREMKKKEVERMDARMVDERRKKKAKPKE